MVVVSRWHGRASVVGVVGTLLLSLVAAGGSDAAPLATSGECRVGAGLYPSRWDANGELASHEAWAGAPLQFGGTFHDVDENDSVADPGFSNTDHILEEVWAARSVPFANLAVQGSAADISLGLLDADIDDWATHLDAWLSRGQGRSLVLAPLQEGNWAGTPYGAEPNFYARAYRRVRQRIEAAITADDRIRWAFAPNNHSSTGEIADYYPGDEAVDVLALSGFNFGSSLTDDGRFHPVHEVFDGALAELRALTRAKPYLLSEVGSSDVGGDREAWLAELFTYATADPNIVGLVYFNFEKSGEGETDWRVWRSSTDGSEAWRTGLRSSTTQTDGRLSSWFSSGALPFAEPDRQPRHFGSNRVLTAVALSQYAFDATDTVVLARADVYADALAGGPLAAFVDGPILLTGSGALHEATRLEVQRLGADRVILLGGTAAIEEQVEADLRAAGVDTVQRIFGADRFGTAVQVSRSIAPTHADVYVTEGVNADPRRGWPDAVSVGAIATKQQRPILFVRRTSVPTATADALTALGVQRVTVIGGSAAVSDTTFAQLGSDGRTAARIAGADRYETSTAVAAVAATAGLDEHHTWFATGLNWPDALTAGPVVARCGGVLVLVHGTDGLTSSRATGDWLADRAGTFVQNHLVGGDAVITDAVADSLRAVADFPN